VVLDHPAFLPTIHHQSPGVPFAIPWFQLRSALTFLKLKHLLTPQLSMTVDLAISDEALSINASDLPLSNQRIKSTPFKSTTVICLAIQILEFSTFKPYFLRNDRDPATCPPQSTALTISRFRTSEISTLIFPQLLLSEACDPLTCVFRRSTVAIPSSLRTSKNSILNFHFPSKCADLCHVSS
jgi:hypothetical protein